MRPLLFKLMLQNVQNNKTEEYIRIHATMPTDVFAFFKYLVNLSRLGTLPELIALKENKITINPHHHCESSGQS